MFVRPCAPDRSSDRPGNLSIVRGFITSLLEAARYGARTTITRVWPGFGRPAVRPPDHVTCNVHVVSRPCDSCMQWRSVAIGFAAGRTPLSIQPGREYHLLRSCHQSQSEATCINCIGAVAGVSSDVEKACNDPRFVSSVIASLRGASNSSILHGKTRHYRHLETAEPTTVQGIQRRPQFHKHWHVDCG